jgi:purine-cytosine permease-like protein
MKVMNLRDLQNMIERGEYDKHPVSQWNPKYLCPYDGTIRQNLEDDCPNPYHPYLPPQAPQASSRSFLYAVVASVCLAFIYSIINNEALVTFIVTFLLLITSVIVFTTLFVIFIYLTVRQVQPLAEIETVEVEKNRRFFGLFFSITSAFFAMFFVSILQRQFPSLTWWIIEFAIAYVLETFVADHLALWMYKRKGMVKD